MPGEQATPCLQRFHDYDYDDGDDCSGDDNDVDDYDDDDDDDYDGNRLSNVPHWFGRECGNGYGQMPVGR